MQKSEGGLEGVVFLRLFTKEILLNLIAREKSKQNVDTEKLKLKLFEETKGKNQEGDAFNNLISNIDQKRINMIHRESIPVSQPTYPIISQVKKEEKKVEEKKVITKEIGEEGMERSITPNERNTEELKRTATREIKSSPQRIDLKRLLGKPIQVSNISPIEKINPLLRDNTVVAIECPGPGKNLMIRKYNQVNMTKIILSEPEINSIIEHFSREARIPLAGGILKAAVGNSIISAVVSEFVGSRFVINKITPYSLIGPK